MADETDHTKAIVRKDAISGPYQQSYNSHVAVQHDPAPIAIPMIITVGRKLMTNTADLCKATTHQLPGHHPEHHNTSPDTVKGFNVCVELVHCFPSLSPLRIHSLWSSRPFIGWSEISLIFPYTCIFFLMTQAKQNISTLALSSMISKNTFPVRYRFMDLDSIPKPRFPRGSVLKQMGSNGFWI